MSSVYDHVIGDVIEIIAQISNEVLTVEVRRLHHVHHWQDKLEVRNLHIKDIQKLR